MKQSQSSLLFKAVRMFIVFVLPCVAGLVGGLVFLAGRIDTGSNLNLFLSHYSRGDPVVWDTRAEEWTRKFRDSWRDIRDEYLSYSRNSTSPLFSDLTVFAWPDQNRKWRSLLLQLTGSFTTVSERFPRTVALLKDSPSTTAMFSVLEPGAFLSPHSGAYMGSRRYHLGLIVPKGRCALWLNGTTYEWAEGGDILFDDNYEHAVINDTPEPRVVLFVDIPRHYSNPLLNLLNRVVVALAFVDPEISAMFSRAELVQ
jgi:ornithine lipid ester-linked acyl 2-hydroxylase